MRLTHLVLGLSLVACRGGSGPQGDDTPDVDGPVGGSVRVQDVQNDSMPVGTVVELKGVIVTAIDSFGARTGDLWVQDPAGGEFSGVKVFGAPLDQIASLQPGDIITISNAEKDEFALTADATGRTVTEIKPAAGGTLVVTKTGTGPLPAPHVVDAKAIEALTDQAAQDAEWEKWEGVLITVTNVRQLSAVTGFSAMNPDQFEFDATGGIAVQSVLAELGTSAVNNTCYSGITGVGDYFFNYLLLPTATDKLVGGGTGCSDIILPVAATIMEVQGGTKTGAVSIDNVFVTGISFNKKSFWIANSATATSNQSVFVFGNAALDVAIVVGSKVNVSGTVQEFNDDANGGALTEITFPTVTKLADAPATIVPVTGMTVTQLLVPAMATTMESVPVTLNNVNLTAIGTATNGFIASATQSGTNFGMGTDVLHLAAGDLGCYATITGFWTNLQAGATGATTKPNAFGFIPATLGTKNGTCN